MRKDAPGFTLVECVITLAVTAVLCSLALPGFSDLLRKQRTATALHLLSAQLAQARNTAIMRKQPATLCPSSGDGRCRLDGDWSRGWLLYDDPGKKDQPTSTSTILSEQRKPFPDSVTVTSSKSRPRLRYQASGQSGGSNLTLSICQDGLLQGEVIVNNVGRVRTRKPTTTTACPNAASNP